MKKRTLALVLGLVLAAGLCSCGDDQSGNDPNENGQTIEQKEEEANKNHYEITYQNAKVYNDSIGTTWVQTIVEIENTGDSNLKLTAGSYDLEDENGSLIASQSIVSEYPSIIAPGEKGYMYEETTIDNYDGDGEITLVPRIKAEKTKKDLVKYNISDVSVSDDSFSGVKVLGRIENQTENDSNGMIYITAAFYDANGTPIGLAFTILDNPITSGEKIGFEFTGFSLPDDVKTENIAETVMYAYQFEF